MFRILLCLSFFLVENRAAKISSGFPTTIPSDTTANSTNLIKISGTGFSSCKSPQNITCHLRGGYFTSEGEANPELNIPDNLPATIIDDSSITCNLPGNIVNLDFALDLKCDDDESFSEDTHVNMQYKTLAEVTPTLRPFLTTTKDPTFLIHFDLVGISEFPQTAISTSATVCWSVSSQDEICSAVQLSEVEDDASVEIPFNFQSNEIGDKMVTFNVKIGDYNLAPKTRRFSTVDPSQADASITQLDHKHRALLLNGEPFISNGWYAHMWTEYLQGRLSFETGLNDLTMLGVLGFNHLQMYSLEALHPAELDQVLHICETYNMHFGWSLTGQTLQLVNETRGFNSSTYWEDILTSMNRIKAHPNLLGWYVCDDCGGGEYPLDSLHKVYNELKNEDPYHLLFGADWSNPWNGFEWGENAETTGLAFDVAQVENYSPHPGDFVDDELNRHGMFFEPMINSPGIYLTGNFPIPRNASFPAVVEASNSFMSLITYDTPSQLNFIFSSVANDGQEASYIDHVEMQGLFGEAIERMGDAVIPDLTKSSMDRNFEVEFVESDLNIAARGFKGEGCDWIVIVNLNEEPAKYSLKVEGGGSTAATHDFLRSDSVDLTDVDFVDGYGSNLLRLGECA